MNWIFLGKGFRDPLQLAGECEVPKDERTWSKSAVALWGLAMLPLFWSKFLWRGVMRIEPRLAKKRMAMGLGCLCENLCLILWAIKYYSKSPEHESEGTSARIYPGDKPAEDRLGTFGGYAETNYLLSDFALTFNEFAAHTHSSSHPYAWSSLMHMWLAGQPWGRGESGKKDILPKMREVK